MVSTLRRQGVACELTDATASGPPVVATNAGGVPSIVDDGVTGFLVDPHQAVPEAVAAVTLLSQPDTWHRMSRAARLRGADELSWDRWAATAASLCARARSGVG